MRLRNSKEVSRKARTPASRAQVNTYYHSETDRTKPSPFDKKPEPKNPRRFIFSVLNLVLLVLLISSIGYSMLLKPNATVEASDYSFHPKQDYQRYIDSQLGRLKYHNKLTFSEKTITDSIKKQFPEVASVRIELPFISQRPAFSLSIAKPSFVLNENGQRYVISSQGTAVTRQTGRGLVTVDDQSGYSFKIGQLVLSSSSAMFIDNLIAQCRNAKVPIASLVLPRRPMELQLKTSDQPYYVKFYLGGDITDEAGQFLAARQHFLQTKQPPSQYLDVRVPGKIFYK